MATAGREGNEGRSIGCRRTPFTAHVNVGFFHGAELADPAGSLEGTGKYMRHVKLRPDGDVDLAALVELIESAHTDMKERLAAKEPKT